MKNQFLIFFLLISGISVFGQPTGYYNGTAGKDGEQLKSALNDIVSGHVQYSYFFSKEIFKISDADPNTPGNVICVYSGFSYPNNNYGTGGDFLNREHVWAKSHGTFGDWPPMYSDVHNLKPEDASVNQSKSNKDYDNGGTQHPEAIECYFTDSTWEARDAVKGDIARIIFYMSTRYEGENGELDLEVVDWNNTYPNAQHGKLSTLLQWNLQDPPDDFERNRNNVIYSFQKNRNPFIDNPEFAELIWGGAMPGPITVENVQIEPEIAVAAEPITITATITSDSDPVSQGLLFWGYNYDSLLNEVDMVADGDMYTAQIPGQAEGTTIYYKVVGIFDFTIGSSVIYNFYVPKIFTGTLVSIFNIQGQQDVSPYKDQVVSTSGVVTANFGSSYFIQDGTGDWNGLYIYESGRNPSVGDSIILTGLIDEYFGKTEMKNVTDYYLISTNNDLPEPIRISTGYVQEGHESVLVKVENAECIDANYQADYFMWKVDDGTGVLKIHNTSVYEFEPVEGVSYNITGPMNYDFDEWKVELRFENDVLSGTDLTAPSVLTVEPILSTNIKIIFSENVEATSAQTVGNYTINNDVVVESASQHAFNKAQVNLTVSPLYGEYELVISNVKDVAGNIMEPQTFEISYVGIEDIFTSGSLSVYPNPATDFMMVALNAERSTFIQVNLVDVTGKIVVASDWPVVEGENNFSIDMKSVPAGIYILEVSANGKASRFKVIKN